VAKAQGTPTAPKARRAGSTSKRRQAEAPEPEVAQEVAEEVDAGTDEGPETTNGRKVLSPEHLEALAAGRDEGRIVRRYLDAMTFRPANSRHRDPDFLRRKLKRLDAAIPVERDVLTRLSYLQQRITTLRELDALGEEPEDLGELEEMFIKAAKRYGERKGIAYQAWRSVGVAPDVLRRAGIHRQQNP
jgi:hypothetical protein